MILAAIKCGAPNKVACEGAGVGESTLYQWLELARERPGSEYAEFAEQLTRARQEGRISRLALIQKAAKLDWRAAAWLLERDMPEEFSMRYKVEHSVKSGEITLGEALRMMRDDSPYMKERRAREQRQLEGGEEIKEAETW